MKKQAKGIGFPQHTAEFLKRLSKNNSKEWFEQNREYYNSAFLLPAQEFVIELGEKLRTIAPEVHAVPKIDKSIFRLHRDVRFSKDKSPFKTNLGILLWEGKRKKVECSGFYFHIEPKMFMLAAGMYIFPKDLIRKYRETIDNTDAAKELLSIMKKIKNYKRYEFGSISYKKVPKGYNPNLPYSDLFRYGGLYAYYESENLDELFSKDVLNYSFKTFKELLPLHQWLVKYLS